MTSGFRARLLAGDAAAGREALARGFSLVCCGIDIVLYSQTAAEIVRALRRQGR